MKKLGLFVIVCTLIVGCKESKQQEVEVIDEVEQQTSVQPIVPTELEDIVTFYVASEKAECQTMIKTTCLQIRENESDDWEFFSSVIEGFDYQPGYEYKIEVRKEPIDNPPADASSIRFVLVKEISKQKVEK